MCYCVFKICFTPSNKIKSLFPTYKPREWTKRRSREQTCTTSEMAHSRHEKEVDNNINHKQTKLVLVQTTMLGNSEKDILPWLKA
jgi:hypothetical protein